MTEKLEPDEKTIASLNASLEKCWNDAEYESGKTRRAA